MTDILEIDGNTIRHYGRAPESERRKMTKRMSEIRKDMHVMLVNNIQMKSVRLIQHDPWTIISFDTYLSPMRKHKHWIHLVGVAKRCYKDKWDENEGIEKAVNRAIAWEVRERIGPAIEVHDE